MTEPVNKKHFSPLFTLQTPLTHCVTLGVSEDLHQQLLQEAQILFVHSCPLIIVCIVYVTCV